MLVLAGKVGTKLTEHPNSVIDLFMLTLVTSVCLVHQNRQPLKVENLFTKDKSLNPNSSSLKFVLAFYGEHSVPERLSALETFSVLGRVL